MAYLFSLGVTKKDACNLEFLTCSDLSSQEKKGPENGRSIIRLSRTAFAMNFPRKVNFDFILFLCDDLVFLANGKGYNPVEA